MFLPHLFAKDRSVLDLPYLESWPLLVCSNKVRGGTLFCNKYLNVGMHEPHGFHPSWVDHRSYTPYLPKDGLSHDCYRLRRQRGAERCRQPYVPNMISPYFSQPAMQSCIASSVLHSSIHLVCIHV